MMAKNVFDIKKFAKAYVKAGKALLKSNIKIIAEHGEISVADPAFGGRRTGEFGEYLQLRTADGDLMFVSVAKGTPQGVKVFAIKELEVTEDFEIDGKTIEAGTVSFKAYAVVAEEEEEE